MYYNTQSFLKKDNFNLFYIGVFFFFFCEQKKKKTPQRKRKDAIVFYALRALFLFGYTEKLSLVNSGQAHQTILG